MARAPKTEEKLLVDARARITWGEDPAKVRARLERDGFEPARAQRTVAALLGERRTTIRWRALLRLALALAALVEGTNLYLGGSSMKVTSEMYAFHNRLENLGILLAIVGFWQVSKAVATLLRPQDYTGPLSDVED